MAERYLKEYMADAPCLWEFPLDHSRTAQSQLPTASHVFSVTLPSRHDENNDMHSLHAQVVAAFGLLATRYCSCADDIVIGNAVHEVCGDACTPIPLHLPFF